MSRVSHACTFAPKYLSQEFGSDNVVLGNFVERADKIVLGKFASTNTSKNYIFNVSKSIKPDRQFFFKRKETLSFSNVKQKYFYEGLDDHTFVSADDLLRFIEILKSNGQYLPELKYGVGGVLSGISHGSDCERFVIVFDNQQYLVFLDNKKTVIAKFAIDLETFGNIKTLLKEINSSLVEYTP